MSTDAFEKIHNIDRKFNALFSRPIYYFAKAVTVISFLLPYGLRIVFAFLINIFFNRPVVYLDFFAKKIGKKVNFVVVGIIYFALFGVYSVFYRFIHLWRSVKKETVWEDFPEHPPKVILEDYFYQS